MRYGKEGSGTERTVLIFRASQTLSLEDLESLYLWMEIFGMVETGRLGRLNLRVGTMRLTGFERSKGTSLETVSKTYGSEPLVGK